MLADLDLLLELAVAALCTVHPNLGVDESEPHQPTVLAGSLIEAAHRLGGLLEGYRAGWTGTTATCPSDPARGLTDRQFEICC